MIDEQFYNEWQSYYESEEYPVTEDVKFICKTKFPVKVFLWLVVSEYGISNPIFFKCGIAANIKICTYPNVNQYFISLCKNTTKRKKSSSGLIWRRIRWLRLEELKIEYVRNEENPPNVPQLRLIENF
jgi:hypothetical protein